ncbi:MAG: ACT domain-containing protein [Xanthomonadales bacterium]|nr:ACT domain-containing protein [Xanthomonadales bacterium]
MAAINDLETLIKHADPRLAEGLFVFTSIPGARYGDLASLDPVAMIQEKEGLAMLIDQSTAHKAGLDSGRPFCLISLSVHSDLNAVGLTAAISACLAEQGIPANLFAGYFHDHILVPAECADQAMRSLRQLGRK